VILRWVETVAFIGTDKNCVQHSTVNFQAGGHSKVVDMDRKIILK
jgi:hypothetical protein